ncbi:hypothetical protein F5148DRAFT_1268924, partial [Russula earlei]
MASYRNFSVFWNPKAANGCFSTLSLVAALSVMYTLLNSKPLDHAPIRQVNLQLHSHALFSLLSLDLFPRRSRVLVTNRGSLSQ